MNVAPQKKNFNKKGTRRIYSKKRGDVGDRRKSAWG
jgi:hypothetical protein